MGATSHPRKNRGKIACIALITGSLFLLACLPPVQAKNDSQDIGRGGSAFIQSTSTTFTIPENYQYPTGQTTASTPSNDPGQQLWDAITGFGSKLWAGITSNTQQFIDWADAFGFLYITPAVLSYKNPMIQTGTQWSSTAMNGLVAFLLILAGYQLIIYRSFDLYDFSVMRAIARLAFAALAANIGFLFLLPQLIELCNSTSLSFLVWMLGKITGDFNISSLSGIGNWLSQPATWGIFLLVNILFSISFIFVQIVRLALLDICIVLAPWWIMLFANEYTRPWGKLGATTFFAALFVQPIQVITIGLGSALIANFGKLNTNDPAWCNTLPDLTKQACLTATGNAGASASLSPIAIAIGLGAMYIALKIPGMLFSEALRASLGNVQKDVSGLTRSLVQGLSFLQ